MSAKRADDAAKARPRPGSVSPIRFAAVLQTARGRTILRLPAATSRELPSRGQVAVHGTINRQPFATVIEPDGDFGHWMSVDANLLEAAGAASGDRATVEIEPAREWPEPGIPSDLRKALASAPQQVRELWRAITPMARWEWVRWINATRNPDTRERRVQVSISKMESGKRRPCCFNLASCTDPELSRSGRLFLG